MVRYTQDKFSPIFMSTVGIDFKYKLIDVNNKKVRLEIWDTAGQERFKAITRSYLRGAQGIILVYDVTEKSTFDHISVWMDQIQQYADISVGKIIVGNKCDLTDKRIITEEHGKELADKYIYCIFIIYRYNVPHFECSAKNGNNVNELFYAIVYIIKFYNNIIDRSSFKSSKA